MPPVFALPLAVLSTPVWFHPGLVVTLAMVFSVPLAALTAHRFGRQISSHRVPRMVWAVSYALCVVATGAVSQGRLGTVVALIVLPILVNTAWQLAENPGWQLALRLGIWIAFASAFAPIVLPMSLGGLLILWYAEGRWVRQQLVVAAVVPLILLGPWLAQRALRPWRAWWEAGYPVPGSATVRDVVLGRAGGPVRPLSGSRSGCSSWRSWRWCPVAPGPASCSRGSWRCSASPRRLPARWSTYSTHAGPADITPWVGIPTVVWIGGLLTAVLLAVPAALSWPRPALASAVVVALVLPLGTAGWWLVRGSADPIDDGRADVVPVFLAERPGDTLIVTGSIDDGVDYRVVAGDGPFLGQEAVTASSSDSARLTAIVRRILAQATTADVDALGDLGIDAIYAPHVDAEVSRRIDAAPRLSPAGSDEPGSRVWTLTPQPNDDAASPPWWHRGLIGLQALAWLVAIVLTAPVRRRTAPEPLDDEEEAEVTA